MYLRQSVGNEIAIPSGNLIMQFRIATRRDNRDQRWE
jgi:hypothetical protein